MNKYLKKTILDELYEVRSDDFASKILEEITKNSEKEGSSKIEEQLIDKIEETVKEEKEQLEILAKLNEFELKLGKEQDFWNKMYYKLGIYDCTELKNIIEKKFIDLEEQKNFFDEDTEDFNDYLETKMIKNLKKNLKYKEMANRIESIKANNPKVRTFLEDKEVIELSNVELNAVLDILKLQEELDNIELKTTFKLGGEEMVQFFKQMNLL